MTTWQPIETAPKDNKRPLYLAHFLSESEGGNLYHLDHSGRFTGKWWESGNDTDNDKPNPTHWAYQDEPIPQVPNGWKLISSKTIEIVLQALNSCQLNRDSTEQLYSFHLVEKALAILNAAQQPSGDQK